MKYKNIYLVISLVLLLFTQASHANSAKDFICTTKTANYVRSMPTTTSESIVRLTMYAPLKVIKKSGEWYKVKGFKYNSFTGWIHKSIVSDKIDCMLINKTYNVFCSKVKSRSRMFYMHEGFKVLKKEIACNYVEDRFGKRYKISSIGAWPKHLTKMIHL